jgi:hypothetical protein
VRVTPYGPEGQVRGEDGEFSLAATAGILLVFVIATVPGAILALPFLTLRIIPMRGRAAA